MNVLNEKLRIIRIQKTYLKSKGITDKLLDDEEKRLLNRIGEMI